MTIDVENAVTEKVAEDGREWFSFGIVMKVGFEDVLDVVGVGGDDVGEDVEVDGGGGGKGKKVSVPI